MQCRLCGFEFNPSTMPCHGACPLGSHCNLICCPNCGYQQVDETKSRLGALLSRLWPGGNSKDEEPTPPARPREAGLVPLSHLAEGTCTVVAAIDPMPSSRMVRLSAFGLVPGAKVSIVQRKPAPVVRIGHTDLALSHDILHSVWVRPPGKDTVVQISKNHGVARPGRATHDEC